MKCKCGVEMLLIQHIDNWQGFHIDIQIWQCIHCGNEESFAKWKGGK